jgi:hypothetical protein
MERSWNGSMLLSRSHTKMSEKMQFQRLNLNVNRPRGLNHETNKN